MKEKLETRKAEIQKEFDALNGEFKKLNEQGAEIDRRLSEIRAAQIRLQGAFSEVTKSLEGIEEPLVN